jgi:hypothetical protein
MTSQPLTPEDELQQKLEEILMFVCHTGSMAQAGKTINPGMFTERADEIMALIKQRDQQKELEWRDALNQQLEAAEKNLAYQVEKTGNQNLIREWQGTIQGIKFCIDAFAALSPSNPQKGK